MALEPQSTHMKTCDRIRRQPLALSSETLVNAGRTTATVMCCWSGPTISASICHVGRRAEGVIESRSPPTAASSSVDSRFPPPPRWIGFVAAIAGDPLAYKEPRRRGVWWAGTSIRRPSILPTRRFSAQREFLSERLSAGVFFCCATPASAGGQTRSPTCAGSSAYRSSDPPALHRAPRALRAQLRRCLGLPWQVVFQTDDRSAVESTAGSGNQVDVARGQPVDHAHDSPRRRPSPTHGEMVWFNHARSFTCPRSPAIRDALLSQLSEETSPTTPTTATGVRSSRTCRRPARRYAEATRTFTWQTGDLLLLDNPADGPRPRAVHRPALDSRRLALPLVADFT